MNINLEKEGKELRAHLIEIKAFQKDNPSEIREQIRENLTDMIHCLKNEDPKIRKNAAIILGESGIGEAVEALVQAYAVEETLFVRPAILEAIGQMDYRKYEDVLLKRYNELQKMDIKDEEKKHLSAEIHLLSELLDLLGGRSSHEYKPGSVSKVILLSKRGSEDILYRELMERFPKSEPKKINGGVIVTGKDLSAFFKVRTWQSMLFVCCRKNGFEKDGEKIAEGLIENAIAEYLNERHVGQGLWRFRVDVRTKDEPKVKAQLAKKTSAALESMMPDMFLNSVSDYEMEIVLMDGADGKVYAYLRLRTIEDYRFNYRENFVATSLKPVMAARIIAASRAYLKDNANILDPFCGVGTLLIERRMYGKAYKNKSVRSLYGVDLYAKAIEGGRANASLAHCPVNFIQRDFFDFTHAYLFDEVLTELPDDFEDMRLKKSFYEKFFEKIQTHLSEGAVLCIYTKAPDVALSVLSQKSLKQHFQCIEKKQLIQKSDSALLIIKYCSEQ